MFPGAIQSVLAEFMPRIIQFSGHGDTFRSGALVGTLAFELEDGTLWSLRLAHSLSGHLDYPIHCLVT